MKMVRTQLKKGLWVERDRKGRFKNVVRKSKSLSADRRKKVGSGSIPKTKGGKLRSGYGHKGDYPRRKKSQFKLFG